MHAEIIRCGKALTAKIVRNSVWSALIARLHCQINPSWSSGRESHQDQAVPDVGVFVTHGWHLQKWLLRASPWGCSCGEHPCPGTGQESEGSGVGGPWCCNQTSQHQQGFCVCLWPEMSLWAWSSGSTRICLSSSRISWQ